MPDLSSVTRVVLLVLRRVILALLLLGLLALSLLAVGFAGPAGLLLYAWLALVLAEGWLLVRDRLTAEAYAWRVAGTGVGLVLLTGMIPAVVIVLLPALPVALGACLLRRRWHRRRTHRGTTDGSSGDAGGGQSAVEPDREP